MSNPSSTQPPAAVDDLLPPVEPPSATFLVQLFVIPGLIVLVMVLVWLLINWLPQMGNDAASNIKAIEGGGANRWQAAVNLANLLHGDSAGTLKRDRELAGRLAVKLEEELAAKKTGEEPALFRVYLAAALGEFYVDAGLGALVKAVAHEADDDRDGKTPSLRVSAAQALAVLSNNLRRETGQAINDPAAIAALIEASRSEQSLLRAAAAYALGEVESEAAEHRLKTLLDDLTHPYARYNAATALARRGDPAVIEVLVEMLATDRPPETGKDDSAEEQIAQRNRLVINGLRAVADLVEANPAADFGALTAAVERLTRDQAREVRESAKGALKKLDRATQSAETAALTLLGTICA